MKREDAYRVVQEQAMKVWQEEKEFKALLLGSEEAMKILTPLELDVLFDPKRSLNHVDYIFEHVGIHE
jgi:adenylosuccinate lyase